MNRRAQLPAPIPAEHAGPSYWRSLDELAATPGFREQLEREFPAGADSIDGVDRRHFMKIMAASFALGGVGLAGCRRPEIHILPYGKSAEFTVPGLPLYYATAMPLRRMALPLVAETHQGRPTKIEGNPSYTPHGGATSLLAQASVLDLYDPDRATVHTQRGQPISAEEVRQRLASVGEKYAARSGEGLAFLAETSGSPTRARLIDKLKEKFPRAVWAEYEPVQDEPPLAAAQASFGRNVRPLYRFSRAKRIVSLDCDFLSAEAGSLYYAREFAKGRRVVRRDDPMNRLYAVESNLTLTGSMADHRLRLASSHLLAFAAALAAKITGDATFERPVPGLDLAPDWIAECAKDLRENRGESLVVAGAHLPAGVHAIVHAINHALGNIGTTVDFVDAAPSGATLIQGLATAIRSDSIKTLVVLGGNPAYNAPVDLAWPVLQGSVPEVIRYGYYLDETSALAGTHVAAAHYLESWGDARTVDGTIVPIQPMILPLFGGLTEIEVLACLLGEETTDPYALVFATIGRLTRGDTDKAFKKFLHDGLLEGSSHERVAVTFRPAQAAALYREPPPVPAFSRENLEVRFVPDHKIDDGRFANNGWLQECPDPITKHAWDNAILVSPRLGEELGITPKGALNQIVRKEEAEFILGRESAPVGELTLDGRQLRGPLHIQPGLANYTIILPLGYGRTVTGRIATGAGYSAYAVRPSAAMHVAVGATLRVLSAKRVLLANTQEHWSMEGRDLVREANYGEFQENPAFVKGIGMESHSPPIYGQEGAKLTPAQKATELPRGNSLYKTPEFDGLQQWGMSIDLNTCIGCNSCVIACQAENNIPIVGRDQVRRGREMHWIRLDRYYSDGKADASPFGGQGNGKIPEDPQVSLQPIACAQCELAPCEIVCPVNATVHDPEGLNVMAYNRCVGTRYCANNCPYKVRRFNFFDWNKRSIDQLYLGPLGPSGMPELVKMVKNPDVTVRMRGVMEKCTYCVQRIQQAKIARKRQAGASGDVVVPDGAIKTACQQVCPVEAIVFGNLLDERSAVARAKAQERDYALLGYLNIRPRTTYLGKLRNPNPRMPDYNALPLSRLEYNRKNHPSGGGEADHETPAKGGHEG
ncbi:MAG: TAT-variant-translocated molybdopterin oxidoreductase [Opitutaceae bacterium]|nr:TAT-variant-translocated molybdopterin oxidoreductase [Opitutaceae bacterium]